MPPSTLRALEPARSTIFLICLLVIWLSHVVLDLANAVVLQDTHSNIQILETLSPLRWCRASALRNRPAVNVMSRVTLRHLHHHQRLRLQHKAAPVQLVVSALCRSFENWESASLPSLGQNIQNRFPKIMTHAFLNRFYYRERSIHTVECLNIYILSSSSNDAFRYCEHEANNDCQDNRHNGQNDGFKIDTLNYYQTNHIQTVDNILVEIDVINIKEYPTTPMLQLHAYHWRNASIHPCTLHRMRQCYLQRRAKVGTFFGCRWYPFGSRSNGTVSLRNTGNRLVQGHLSNSSGRHNNRHCLLQLAR